MFRVMDVQREGGYFLDGCMSAEGEGQQLERMSKGRGGLKIHFLRGGGMDLIWNVPMKSGTSYM